MGAPDSAVAAEAAGDDVLELAEVTVTGSRIVRRDLTSNSPLVTVDNAELESRTGLNIESYLNQLPAFNPSFSPVTSQGDVQITPVNTVGIAALSMRGFGPNRSLVLVDGHRPTPINALMVPDINAIPSALIERVEIISGGASAVYGADAIGGVTNFIMRNDFQGLELDAQTGITEVGDSEETRLSALLGTNFADGRGNVTLGIEHYDRQSALEKERDFYKNAWRDPTVGGDLFLFGYNGYNTGQFVPSNAALEAVFAGRPAGTGYRPLGGTGTLTGYRFNEDGSLFNTAGDYIYKFLEGGGTIDGVEFARQTVYDNTRPEVGMAVDNVKWNNLQAMVSGPQKRYSLFASGNYDITDSLEFFARGTWAQSKTRTLLLPTNASLGWEASIPYDPTTDSPVDPTLNYADQATVAAILANPAAFANPGFIGTGAAGAQHPVPVELAVLLNSRGVNAAEPWLAETFPADSFDQRATLNTIDTWNIETGLRFDLGVSDWTGEVYFSHGEASTYTNAFGNNSLTRWRALVAEEDYGRGAELTGNTTGARPTFGAADITCTSGFYDMLFHGDVRPSDDCRTAVEANLQSRTQSQQNIAELNLQGGLFSLPAGEVRSALGFQYRENAAQFYPDILQSTSSFTDQVIGVYPTGYLDAKTSVKDYYGELLIPLVSDLPFAQRVELELGGRYSDYEDTDSTFTYKISGNWQFTDQWRLRGGYNRATRAPNLGELFLNVQEIFTIGGANFGDPCSARSNAPYGAGGAIDDPVLTGSETNPPPLAAGQTAEGAASALLICQAQMGVAGSTQFYTNNQAGGGGSLFNWILQEGNPNLDSEKANTWTAGLVYTSNSANPWLAGMSLALDWWEVEIKDAIQQYSVDYARYLCYGAVTVTTPAEAAAQADSVACRNAGRDLANGAATTVKIAYDNQATIATSGVDLQLNWRANLADLGMESVPGGFGVNMQYSWLDYYKTKQSPTVFDPTTDWKGTLGPTLTGTNAGAYSYRLNTTFSYILNDMGFSLRWRHLPSVWPAAKAGQDAVIANNEAVTAGDPGILLTYTPGTWIKTKSYNQIDLSFNWSISDTLSLRAGIDNAFDWMPRITGGTRGYPAGTDLSQVCGAPAAPGCQNPFGPSLASSGRGTTSPGYYDTLGRRYFLGVKVRL